jgi:3',5'-cyclic AMP phosphodiesterase CpdA
LLSEGHSQQAAANALGISRGKLLRTLAKDKPAQITDEQLDKLKRLYCAYPKLTIEELCQEMDLSREELFAIKREHGLTHYDPPCSDERVITDDPDEIAEDVFLKRGQQVKAKLTSKEIQKMRQLFERYSVEEYRAHIAAEVFKSVMPEFAKTYTGPTSYKPHQPGSFILEVPIVDLHLGKLAWQPETGEHYDYKIARERFNFVIDDVFARASEKPIERILFPFASDYFHVDNKQGATTHGTMMDVDSRTQKLFIVGVKMLIEAIDKLNLIAPVSVVLVPGNHDDSMSFFALQNLMAWYRDSKTVEVWDDLKRRKYVEFGNVLIGYDHGDLGKRRLPGNMSVEVPESWGRTRYREWHTGHLHRLNVSEESGVTVRELSSLSGTDAWHYNNGFVGALCRSQSFLWHREKGLHETWDSTIWVESGNKVLQI